MQTMTSPIQWGNVTLHLDQETFRKAFNSGGSMYFEACEYEAPHVASAMHTLAAAGSVLDEDGKGGYHFDRMSLPGPFDILGFAPWVDERAAHGGKPGGTRSTSQPRRRVTGKGLPRKKSFVACER